MSKINKIGEILIKKKYITKKQLEHALNDQGQKPLGETLVEMGYVKEHEISEAFNSTKCDANC